MPDHFRKKDGLSSITLDKRYPHVGQNIRRKNRDNNPGKSATTSKINPGSRRRISATENLK